MLDKKQILTISAIVGIILLSPISLAAVTCGVCQVDSCVCQITECQSGMFNVFTISDCSGVPYVRDTFSGGMKTWYPPQPLTYYVLALCDDGTTRSVCTLQQVLPAGTSPTPTTTTTTTTTEETVTTTEFTTTTTKETGVTYETPPSGGGFNFLWIVIVIFIVMGVAFYFLRIRKKKEVSYEEVYKKWSR